MPFKDHGIFLSRSEGQCRRLALAHSSASVSLATHDNPLKRPSRNLRDG